MVSIWHQTHLSPTAQVPGAVKVMPAGFQQLGGEVISVHVPLHVPVHELQEDVSFRRYYAHPKTLGEVAGFGVSCSSTNMNPNPLTWGKKRYKSNIK